MALTIIRTTYHGPTDHNGSRFTVTNLRTGERKTVPYSHAARHAARDAVEKVTGVGADTLVWGGEDTKGTYWIIDATEGF